MTLKLGALRRSWCWGLLASLSASAIVLLTWARLSANVGGGGGYSDPPTVQFDSSSYTVVENAGTVTATVTLSAPSAQVVTVTCATADGIGPDGATAPGDYIANSQQLVFQPGQTSQPFTVGIVNDQVPEPTKTFSLTLSNPVNASVGSPAPATVTIIDDDLPPPSVKLREVHFTGFPGATGHPLTDVVTGVDITAPEWLDANLNGSTDDVGDKNDPAAFVRNQSFLVKAVFAIDGIDPSQVSVWAEGGVFGGLNSADTAVALNASNEAILQINVPSTTVAYREAGAWSWTWKYRVGSDPTAYTLGTSSHTLLITYGVPGNSPTCKWTMIPSCQSLDGFGDDPGGPMAEGPPQPSEFYVKAADQLFKGFEANAKVSGKMLKYDTTLGDADDGSVKKLKINKGGSCTSWALYFLDEYISQGLPPVNGALPFNYVGFELVQKTGNDCNFPKEVKWQTMYITNPGMNQTKPLWIEKRVRIVFLDKYGQAAGGATDVNDSYVGENWPVWIPKNHAVVMLQFGKDTIIYDTSYGKNPYTVSAFTIPALGSTAGYRYDDNFMASYLSLVVHYFGGTIMLLNAGVQQLEDQVAVAPDNAAGNKNGPLPNRMYIKRVQ